MGFIVLVFTVCLVALLFRLVKPSAGSSSSTPPFSGSHLLPAQLAPPLPAARHVATPPEHSRDVTGIAELTSKEKGDAFEQYVVSQFSRRYFKLRHWRSDKGINGVYAESNKDPDLEWEFTHQNQTTAFVVECKWRAKTAADDTLLWAKERQWEHYCNYAKRQRLPVFVIIGLGGTADTPEEVYVVPLDRFERCRVGRRWLSVFRHRDVQQKFFFDPVQRRLG